MDKYNTDNVTLYIWLKKNIKIVGNISLLQLACVSVTINYVTCLNSRNVRAFKSTNLNRSNKKTLVTLALQGKNSNTALLGFRLLVTLSHFPRQ